jgi:hypothetical protein
MRVGCRRQGLGRLCLDGDGVPEVASSDRVKTINPGE